jgi:hypothetical protein
MPFMVRKCELGTSHMACVFVILFQLFLVFHANGVGIVCIYSTSFIFNCTRFIDNSYSSIFRIHATIVASSSFDSSPNRLIVLDLFYHSSGKKYVRNVSHNPRMFFIEHVHLLISPMGSYHI